MANALGAVEREGRRYSDLEWQTRVDLAACYRLADLYGMTKMVWNHITARVPGTDEILINEFGLGYDEVRASNLVKLHLDGRVLDGRDSVNLTGYVIHSAIHAARPDVLCVMHTHTHAGVAVSALESGFQPYCQEAMMFHGRVGYHVYEGMSTELDERERLAASLGDNIALVMRNHGVLTVGRTVPEAFVRMFNLDMGCRIQMALLSSGQALVTPPPEVCRHAAEQWDACSPDRDEWPALLRRLESLGPDYRT